MILAIAIAVGLSVGYAIVHFRRAGAVPVPKTVAVKRATPDAPTASPTRATTPGEVAVPPAAAPETATAGASTALDVYTLRRANQELAERLWRLGFEAPNESSEPAKLPPEQIKARDSILSALRAEVLDPKYFPRRPTLMNQLMKALDDPHAAPDKLSRIIAHDPVLAADVLRLANSILYRTSTAPIDSIPRAVVVCGADALRGILAVAMLRPVFRATRSNFPRLPRILWERTERAARAAELYSIATHPEDRFEAQLAVLLSAVGPLVVYSAALDVYSQMPGVVPHAAVCVELTRNLGPLLAQRVAREWQTSQRLTVALEKITDDPLATSLYAGEFLGSLSYLESQGVLSQDDAFQAAHDAGLPDAAVARIWSVLKPVA